MGFLSWNLPDVAQYPAGTPLQLNVRVTNPGDAERTYRLQEELSQDGQVISRQDLSVGGQTWFVVPAGSYVELQGTRILDRTNVTYALVLIEQSAGQVDRLEVKLTGPQAAGAVDWMSPLMGVMVMMAFGTVIMRMGREHGR